MKEIKLLIIIILLSGFVFSINIYSPGVNDVTVTGSENLLIGDTEVYYDVYNGYYRVFTKYVQYNIVPQYNEIHCFQLPTGGYPTRNNLTIDWDQYGGGMLSNLTKYTQTSGYITFKNDKLILVVHADGTLWVYVTTPAIPVTFKSRIDQDYDVGGGKLLDPTLDEADEGIYIRKRNWLVITDDDTDTDNILTSGGFGIYTRPAYSYNSVTNPTIQNDKDYKSYMTRCSSNQQWVKLNSISDEALYKLCVKNREKI